jgi:hypothetical protein
LLDGRLFTRDFLLEGIRETEAWLAVDAAARNALKNRIEGLARSLAARKKPNEAQTEEDLIYPVFELLGWNDKDVQTNAAKRARGDVPDALLYPDAVSKRIAGPLEQWQRLQHGVCIVEAEKWQKPLDSRDKESQSKTEPPSSQMLRYLRRVEDRTAGKLRWGILTNGRIWRLYFHTGAGTAENFLELDIGKALLIEGCEADLLDKAPHGFASDDAWRDHILHLFVVMFGRDAFLPLTQGDSFHALALQEGQRWELKVAKNLSEKVFKDVFPALSQTLAKNDPSRPAVLDATYLEEVRNGALILLYRLLFVLYAEDRNLLPDESGKYAEVCLTRIRQEVAAKFANGLTYTKGISLLWPRLAQIFRAIAEGNDDLGIPPYNGGLFDRNAAPILERTQLPDFELSAIIFALSHEHESETGRGPRYINYRDLSVQQLGSVYERLLEFQLKQEAGEVTVALNAFGRKSSGSYYTPDELVKLIITRTVGPLVEEAEQAFRNRAGKTKNFAELHASDTAQAILKLKICDPAMGSGHFLVTLVDWMTDRVLEAMATTESIVEGYVSPVAARIEDIRSRILALAEQHGWPIVKNHLDNRQVVRRMVLKRCVYGVDLNPMAVELAKVSLWLHSFTVGAPLSFLDHHLVCGNALFGERVRPVMDWAFEGNLLINEVVQKARGSSRGMAEIEEQTDADISEAKNSKNLFDKVKSVTHDLRAFMDVVHGVRWADTGNRVRKRAINRLQRGDFGNPLKLLSGEIAPPVVSEEQRKLLKGEGKRLKLSTDDKKKLADAEDRAAVPGVLEAVRIALGRERFLHWEVAFPGVWNDWESNEPRGGFDAVIGNPPWDRMKFQEVEWFADRKPEIAMATRAADRKGMVDTLLKSSDPIVGDYHQAVARAEGSAKVARDGGSFPMLSGGDVNLYSLFVERSLSLLKPDGIMGLLTPSGIASDKSASAFFKSVATTGRLGSLLDFENRRGELEPFFPDVDSRFKFCVLVIAGQQRRFAATTCAFFLRGVETLADPERCFELTPEDFDKVNPNTGTAPILRTKRDAEITTGIYSRFPVLVDRRDDEPKAVFPVRYNTMFHMTNDSHLFVTKPELEKSAYPVGGGRWRKGAEEFVPLLVGRSIKHFDHRAASVLVNEENLHNAALSGDTALAQHEDPVYNPQPQYWVSKGAVEWPSDLSAVIAFRDIARPTDVRTVISTLVPFSGAGNTLPLILPDLPENKKAARAKALAQYQEALPLLVGNFNAIPFDYVARQKVQSTHLNWYIVEQLPVIPPLGYQRRFGPKSAAEIVREEVLALTYTAHDMAPFARDMGYIEAATGEVKPPILWNSLDRLRRRAKLDALYFMLYFPSHSAAELASLRETATYIYSTFPIVEREEQNAHGRFLSRELCLHYINALAAGDPDVVIEV